MASSSVSPVPETTRARRSLWDSTFSGKNVSPETDRKSGSTAAHAPRPETRTTPKADKALGAVNMAAIVSSLK
jgi:hypothetical protein